MPKPPVILLAGPTGSGKSALARRLASEFGGVIVNADSMQVYRELRILTARPSLAEEAANSHQLYGHVPSSEPYSAGRFVREASDAITTARSGGQAVIVAGGTGLYFQALIDGLPEIPEIDSNVRAHWRAEATRLGPERLHSELESRDPVMASRLRPSDPQRIVRALEVLQSTGRSLADWHQSSGSPAPDIADAFKIYLDPDRSQLAIRLAARLDHMIAAGAIDEAKAFAALNLPPDRPATRALGLSPMMACAAGTLSVDGAITLTLADTARYVKRQRTWARKYMIAWNRIFEQETQSIANIVITIVRDGS